MQFKLDGAGLSPLLQRSNQDLPVVIDSDGINNPSQCGKPSVQRFFPEQRV